MVEYSHDGAITFGYGDSFNEKQDGAALSFTLQRCTREPKPFPDECITTARLMQEKAAGRPIYLLQSGGMDSEVMIKSFMAAGIPFAPITFRYPNGLNYHEMQYVERFSDRHQLDTKFYDIDVLPWLETQQARDWFHLSNCWEVAMLPHMKLLHHVWYDLGGMPVLGGGDTVILKKNGEWYFSKYEYMLAWYWFCRKMDINAGIAFFQHTSEMTLSMLREPMIERAASGNDALASSCLPNLRAVKNRVYLQHWPDLQKRVKFGGSELIHNMTVPLQDKLRAEAAQRYDTIWSVPYAELRASLEP